MTLGEILAGVEVRSDLPASALEAAVLGLEYDSRKVAPGFLFFAFPGQRTDGRRYAREALERGALAVLSQSERPPGFDGCWIEVEHGRRALALAARSLYRRPDERIRITGITGTNGKTTTSYLLDSILRAAGKQTALVGTVEYHLAGQVLPAANTTPESLDLYRIFDRLERAGGDHATIEVSSHALALGRVYGIQFHAAVFTNLTRDHLDFHVTMEDYFAAKRALFEGSGAAAPHLAVINHDDEYGRSLSPAGTTEVLWYGMGEPPRGARALRAREVASGFEGLRMEAALEGASFEIVSPLIGKINVYNILAACAAGLGLGFDAATIRRGVAELASVPGRFERIDEGQPFLVVVDYAHTDDALRNVIAVARSLKPKRVITLFGCGGDRDRAKRPLMGQAAAEASDFVVLTSDNPRSEDPLDIINDALVGLRRLDTPHLIEPDREKAIHSALEKARAGDTVIIAGKGHEPYQVLKDRTIAFDDREAARRVLRGLGHGRARP